MIAVLLACMSSSPERPARHLPDGTPADDTGRVSGSDSRPPVDTAPERLPGDTSPPRTLDAPAQVTLDCPDAIPVDGKVDCTIAFHWPDGAQEWAGRAGVGLHGRSSAGFPKPQYAVELRDDAGADADVGLYGMVADADWVLNGMYIDRALFRNKLAYDLFREAGGGVDWAPATTYVELTLDGAAQGLFLLTERVEPSRLPMPEDDGSGTWFVVRADEEGTIPTTLQYAPWLVLDPEGLDAAIAPRLDAFEAGLRAQDGSAWDVADLDSFARFVLLEELLKNNDAYYLSHHAWVAGDGKLHFTPWDLDLTLGQPLYNNNELASEWILYRPDLVALPGRDPRFRATLQATWAEWRAGPLAGDGLVAREDAYRAFLGDAIDRNWAIWDFATVQFGGSYLPVRASPDEEYAAVTAWTQDRVAWVDAHLADF